MDLISFPIKPSAKSKCSVGCQITVLVIYAGVIIPKLRGQSKTQLLSHGFYGAGIWVWLSCMLWPRISGAGGRVGATLISRLNRGGSSSSLTQEVAGRMQFLTG